ncbi:flavin-containing monooxygenase FMO GS-OX5-like isoform X2 [Triticum dicoccoides]|uniref:flavin-containing monooxygenase FMO GS-OX5-like isoform X2 n=1 Tax=Triticum dicoccoides TaxID=85692 RepID=UPI00188E2E17|nr:flavin-containing monooxygenase FMO GS-OX5-like isoform X2 [Triticum dicoccoides]
MPSRRVAVIGAGAAGLVAARELLREGHAPVVFERAAGVGGTWLYDDEASADPLGAGGVHGSLYASLRTNLPRESMGFLDFPFVADEDSVDPRRFPGHQEVLRYLEAFARRFDLLGLVRLETEVVSVRRGGDASWSVSYCSRKLAGAGSDLEEEQSEVFDAVVVCNGHFAEPRLADIAGIDGWPGKQLHSHSYRVPDQFRGQVVVIIGYNPSGMDISRDIAGVAKEVHVAIRAAPAEMESTTAHAIANLWLHPMIHRAEEDGSMVFQDGSRVQVQLPVPRRRRRRRLCYHGGRQPGRPAVQARVPTAAGPSHLLRRTAIQGDPFPGVPAPEQLGGRGSVGEDRAPVAGGDDAGRGGVLHGHGGPRAPQEVHPRPGSRHVRVRGLAGGAVRAGEHRGVEEGDLRHGERQDQGPARELPG